MGMKKDLGQTLKNERIQSLSPKTPLVVSPETSLETVITKMKEARLGCVLIEEQGKLVGICTERDLMTRVVEPQLDLKTPVVKVMTQKPKCLKMEDSVVTAIRLMSDGGYRHVPLVDASGKIQSVLSAKTLIRYLAEHFPYEIYNLPPDPHQTQKAREGA